MVAQETQQAKQFSIVLIGSGNVAHHLCATAIMGRFKILQIFSRNIEHAQALASTINCEYTNQYSNINPNADLYIIAAADDAIADIASSLPSVKAVVCHTAGSVAIDVLQKHFENCGVLYPLQSFSKYRNDTFSTAPLLIEANNNESLNVLNDFAGCLSPIIHKINSETRMAIHVAAVFANNFSNHMASIAYLLMKDKNANFDILKPLMQETFQKIMESNPIEAQTGPAVRNDQNILNKHEELLQSYPNFKDIYKKISESIFTLNELHKNGRI